MKLVVTGANGFIGRRVVARLAAGGHTVIAAARRFPPAPVPSGPFVDWQTAPGLGAEANWSPLLQGAEVVIHAGARVHVMRDRANDPLAEFRQINVEGSMALARQAATAGVRRFVFISSIKVNGETTDRRGAFCESDIPAPSDPYGVSKWEAEQAIAALGTSSGMEVTAIRPVLVYGAGVAGNMATLARLAARRWPLPFGAAHNRRSLVHVNNLADFIVRAATIAGPVPAVLLVRDNESISVAELLSRMARAHGRTAWLVPVSPKLFRGAARLLRRNAWADRIFGSLEVDDGASRRALAWHPPVALDAGLAEMASGSSGG